MAAGDNAEANERYLLDFPEFIKVPYNDVEAMRAAVDDDTCRVARGQSRAVRIPGTGTRLLRSRAQDL